MTIIAAAVALMANPTPADTGTNGVHHSEMNSIVGIIQSQTCVSDVSRRRIRKPEVK